MIFGFEEDQNGEGCIEVRRADGPVGGQEVRVSTRLLQYEDGARVVGVRGGESRLIKVNQGC